jgi:hypothetical protein
MIWNKEKFWDDLSNIKEDNNRVWFWYGEFSTIKAYRWRDKIFFCDIKELKDIVKLTIENGT